MLQINNFQLKIIEGNKNIDFDFLAHDSKVADHMNIKETDYGCVKNHSLDEFKLKDSEFDALLDFVDACSNLLIN